VGMNGTIVIFPTGGKPPSNPESIAKQAIEVFERLRLLLPNTAKVCEKPKPSLGRFSESLKSGELRGEDYALYIVPPSRILTGLRELVFLLDGEEPGTFELPYVDFSVIKKALPVTSAYDGRVLATTWSTIEFSYEDVRYDPEIHRIRDVKHPVFSCLAEIFSSAISWDVDIS
jgi:hypothetical protein